MRPRVFWRSGEVLSTATRAGASLEMGNKGVGSEAPMTEGNRSGDRIEGCGEEGKGWDLLTDWIWQRTAWSAGLVRRRMNCGAAIPVRVLFWRYTMCVIPVGV